MEEENITESMITEFGTIKKQFPLENSVFFYIIFSALFFILDLAFTFAGIFLLTHVYLYFFPVYNGSNIVFLALNPTFAFFAVCLGLAAAYITQLIVDFLSKFKLKNEIKRQKFAKILFLIFAIGQSLIFSTLPILSSYNNYLDNKRALAGDAFSENFIWKKCTDEIVKIQQVRKLEFKCKSRSFKGNEAGSALWFFGYTPHWKELY